MTLRTPKPGNANTPANKSKQGAQNDQQPISDDPNNILFLQRTVGNQAVNQMLKSQHPVITQTGSAALQPKIQRKIMPYEVFLAKSGQTADPAREDIFNGKQGQTDLDKTRGAINPDSVLLSISARELANINRAYQKVQTAETEQNLMALHHTIVYWQTLFADTPAARENKDLLDSIVGSIKDEFKSVGVEKKEEKKSQGFLGKALGSVKDTLISDRKLKVDDSSFAKPERPTQSTPFQMPAFMKDMGVPYDYFKGNFVEDGQPKTESIAILEMIYTLLNQADKTAGRMLGQVQQGFDELEKPPHNIGTTYLLKGLLYARFAAVLKDIVGTNREENVGKALTKAEIDAIITYSKEKYDDINTEARGAAPVVKAGRTDQKRGAKVGNEKPLQNVSLMELAVSGLNKLPKYQGTVYRGLAKPPAGFEAFVHEGSEIADLAFSSASPALTAVDTFLSSKSGPANIYYVLQSKTASNILNYSFNVHEGEVLFRPGTRFKVDKIWKHDAAGKLPPDAPSDVKMILMKKGPFRNDAGRVPREGEKAYPTTVLMATEI